MQESNDLNSSDQEFEDALRSLRPAAPPVWSDAAYRIGFATGRQSRAVGLLRWRIAAVLLAGVSALSFVPHAHPPMPLATVNVVVRPPPPRVVVDPNSAFALREAVLSGGLDALPVHAATDPHPIPSVESLN